MSKQLIITDPKSKEKYVLEYTRKTVSLMERNGFVAEDVTKHPMTMLPALFSGAFLAHHRTLPQEAIDKIYSRMPHKDELIPRLVAMYNDPIATLMEEPVDEGDEGNLTWEAGW